MTFFPLEPFLQWLRESGFRVGTDHYTKVSQLLKALPQGTEAGELRTLLAPLFARSPKEQQRFYQLFDRYYAQYAAPASAAAVEAAEPGPTRTGWLTQVRQSLNHRWVFAIFAISFSALALYVPVTVFFSLKGDGERPPAHVYLERYGLDESDYWWHLGEYLLRDLLVQPQPCDSLRGLSFSYTLNDSLVQGYEIQVASAPLFEQWNYQWFVNDSLRASGPRAALLVADTGSYEIRLRARTEYGCRTDFNRLIQVVANRNCQAGFRAEVVPGQPRQLLLRDTSQLLTDDEVVNWQWSQNGEVLGSEAELLFTFPPGVDEQQVCLNLRTDEGCQAQSCQVVQLTSDAEAEAPLPLNLGPMPRPDLRPLDSSPLGPYYPLFLAIVVLAGMISYDLYLHNRSQVFRSRKRARQGPFTWTISLPEPPRLYPETRLHQLSVQLRRRQDSEERLLSIPGTIEATLDQGGLPTLAYRPGSRPAEYLFLIERKHQRDHWAHWARQLAQQLVAQDVFIEAYYYRPDFETLESVDRGEPVSLGELQLRFPRHRLVVFGNGEGLTDAMRGSLSALAHELLSWPERLLLTPAHPQQWSLREVALARHMQVAPAGTYPLMQFPDWLELQQSIPLGQWRPTAGAEPPSLSDDPNLGPLAAYLGPERLRWVAMCAIFPELHPDLSWQLAETAGVAPSEEAMLPVFQLSWFREGQIPEGPRKALLNTLSRQEKQAGRKVVVDLLAQQQVDPDTLAAERWQIQLTTQRWALQEGNWWENRQLSDQMQEYLEREEVEDETIWEMVNRNQGGIIPVKMPQGWRRRFFRKGIPLLGWRGYVKYSLVILLILVGLFPYYRQRLAPVAEKVSLQQWLNQQRNLVEIDGTYYRLENRTDSALYFSHLGSQFYDLGEYGSAYNEFDLALRLRPFTALFNYQRGLAGQRLLGLQYEDSLAQLCYQDFARSVAFANFDLQLKPQDRLTKRAAITQAMLGPDGHYLLATYSGQVYLYDVDEQQEINRFMVSEPVKALTLVPDQRLTMVAQGPRLQFYQLGTGKLLDEVIAHERDIQVLSVSADQRWMISGGADRLGQIWDLERREVLQTLEFIHTGEVRGAAFSPDGEEVVTVSDDSTAVVWRCADGRYLEDYRLPGPLAQVAFLGHRSLLALLTESGELWYLDRHTRRRSRRMPPDWRQVYHFALSGNGHLKALAIRQQSDEVVHYPVIAGAGQGQSKALNLTRFIPLVEDLPQAKDLPAQVPPMRGNPQVGLSQDGTRALATFPGQGLQVFHLDYQPWSQGSYREAWYGWAVATYQRRQWAEAMRAFQALQSPTLPDDWRARGFFGDGVAQLYALRTLPDSLSTPRFLRAVYQLAQATRLDSSLRQELRGLTSLLLKTYQALPAREQLRDEVCALVAQYRQGACRLFDYDEVLPYQQGLAAVRQSQRWGYLDSLQGLVIPLQYQQAGSFQDSGLARVVPISPPKTRSEPGAVLIDREGKVIFDQMLEPSEGLIGVRRAEDGRWGFVSERSFGIAVPTQYDRVWPFRQGYAKVEQNNLYGLIDRRGRLQMDGLSYVYLEITSGEEPAVALRGQNQLSMQRFPYPSTLRNWQMDSLVQVKRESGPDAGAAADPTVTMIGNRVDGLALAFKGGLYGYVTLPGQGSSHVVTTNRGPREVVVAFQYEEAYEYSYERAAVRRPAEPWGYLDRLGRLVIPMQYDSVGYFQMMGEQVLARVSRRGETFYIDRNGNCVEYGDWRCPGRIPVVLEESYSSQSPAQTRAPQPTPASIEPFEQNGRWGLRRNDGTVLIEPRFDQRFSFEQGLARVRQDGLWGFITKEGKILVPPTYGQVKNFSNGLAAVRSTEGRWGFINEQGQQLIDFLFDEVRSFQDGTTIVRIGKTSFRIDRRGQRIGSRKY